MAKFETVPLAELKTRLPAKLMPLVADYKDTLEKLFSLDSRAQASIWLGVVTPATRVCNLACKVIVAWN